MTVVASGPDLCATLTGDFIKTLAWTEAVLLFRNSDLTAASSLQGPCQLKLLLRLLVESLLPYPFAL